MNKRVVALLACCLLVVCCVRQSSSRYNSSFQNYSVATQEELDQANERINQLKEEFLVKGFRFMSISSSDLKEEVVLKGDYGGLKDIEVKLRTGKRLDPEEPPLGGGVSAFIPDKAAEQEFDQLYHKIAGVVRGHP